MGKTGKRAARLGIAPRAGNGRRVHNLAPIAIAILASAIFGAAIGYALAMRDYAPAPGATSQGPVLPQGSQVAAAPLELYQLTNYTSSVSVLPDNSVFTDIWHDYLPAQEPALGLYYNYASSYGFSFIGPYMFTQDNNSYSVNVPVQYTNMTAPVYVIASVSLLGPNYTTTANFSAQSCAAPSYVYANGTPSAVNTLAEGGQVSSCGAVPAAWNISATYYSLYPVGRNLSYYQDMQRYGNVLIVVGGAGVLGRFNTSYVDKMAQHMLYTFKSHRWTACVGPSDCYAVD